MIGWSSIKQWIKHYVRKAIYVLPVQKNKVVFLNYDGKGFGDNPKYIAEEIMDRNAPCKLVWLADGDVFVPKLIKRVERFSLKGFYELSTARVIVNNCKSNIPSYYKKKSQQFYLQTWHGDFALKYIEKEIEEHLSVSYLTATKADSAMTDAVVSGSRSFSEILKESFWLPENCTILEYGVPRNDIYFRGDVFKKQLKQKLGFSQDEKILLYAPTFRDKGATDCYDLDFSRLRKVLCQSTYAVWRIIVRLHPNVSRKAGLFCYDEWIIEGSRFSDQQELCLISDGLITDYSSIMGDFLLMRKPVFLYVPDLDEYSSHTTGRGLRRLFYHLPLPFNRTQEAVEEQIAVFDQVVYDDTIDAFMQENYLPFDDGHASERVVDFLENNWLHS